jgi:hypothetical protein
MPGARTIPTQPIVPELPTDGVSEVEADRAQNAKWNPAFEATFATNLAQGNLTNDEGRDPPDSGPTPFGALTRKR